jgi:hypothetical protein
LQAFETVSLKLGNNAFRVTDAMRTDNVTVNVGQYQRKHQVECAAMTDQ